VRLNSGLLQVGAAGATFNFQDTLFQWSGNAILNGSRSGLKNLGTITLPATGGIRALEGYVDNVGTINDAGGGGLVLNGLLTNESLASFNFTQDNANVATQTADSTFNNLAGGTVSKSGSMATDVSTLAVAFFNNMGGGTVNVQTGTLTLAASGTSTGGTFSAAPDAFMKFGPPFTTTYTLHDDTQLNGGGTFQVGSTLTVDGRVNATGNIVVLGDTGAATLHLTVTGVLNVIGDYIQLGGFRTLRIDIAGTTPGTTYGQLNIIGNAELNGGLDLRIVDPLFEPTIGVDTFQILRFTSHTIDGGAYDGRSFDVGDGKQFTPSFDAGDTGLTLTTTST
jgi:hypothetical protein